LADISNMIMELPSKLIIQKLLFVFCILTIYTTCRSVRARDEIGQKRSVNTKTIFVFIFSLENEIENINYGNENDIGNLETLETKVTD
jgi:hypothetical protein